MKIGARIENLGGDQYLCDGKVFDSSLSARREIDQRVRTVEARYWNKKRLTDVIPVSSDPPKVSCSDYHLEACPGRDGRASGWLP
jgi:hypothetical protein